jgi:hypothetical protein
MPRDDSARKTTSCAYPKVVLHDNYHMSTIHDNDEPTRRSGEILDSNTDGEQRIATSLQFHLQLTNTATSDTTSFEASSPEIDSLFIDPQFWYRSPPSTISEFLTPIAIRLTRYRSQIRKPEHNHPAPIVMLYRDLGHDISVKTGWICGSTINNLPPSPEEPHI